MRGSFVSKDESAKKNSNMIEGDINQTPKRAKWIESLDPSTRRLLEEDAAVFLHQSMSSPCMEVVESCKNSSLKTLSGREILDFHGNNVHQIGYGNEYVVQKVMEQMVRLPFSPRRYTNQVAIDFAQRLTGLLPDPLSRVLFAPGGTSAIGMALKLARVVTGKHKVVSLWDSFHGASLDAISVGGESVFRQDMGPMMPGVIRIPPPATYRGFFGDNEGDQLKYADYLEYVIEKEGDIGAFVAETIRNTDVQIPSLQYWQRVREICDKHGVLLILDEIPIAMGRTGKMFAFEHYGIVPDILCLGKGLGGGLIPMAAMVCREEYNVAGHISLGHYTFEKNPLGCAAGLATLEFIEENQILKKVVDDEQFMADQMDALKELCPKIGDVRGKGLLWGVELVENIATKEKAVDLAEKVMYQCLKQGLSFKVSQGNVIQLSPALTISREDLSAGVTILKSAIIENME
ncbi:aspartate aminotransferase family protein [Anaerophaga thermohalophila]|uniref:aspartate aminotransferase family protein n=1 Tax=Anaerophaga thermohalophila TaxID=177400 RepID=UPI002478D8B4|nr:aspartate aminotransferase family protein [Anaerophaga thermohalophila]